MTVKVDDVEVGTVEIPVWLWVGVVIGVVAMIIAIIALGRR